MLRLLERTASTSSRGSSIRAITRGLVLPVVFLAGSAAFAQTPQPGSKAPTGKPGVPASTTSNGGRSGAQGGDSKSASGSDTKVSASGKQTHLSPLDPAPPPVRAFSRPRIGLALGGGGAVALSEVGVLEWFEENHIPVDVIAGTSMGCMVSALYSTGRTPEQLKRVMNGYVFNSVFSITNSYQSRSFRRREETRELPNGIAIGLHKGVSFRNAVLVDQGLNSFLDREFLRYDDQTDFNALPIPLRCMSTDLNDAKAVTFARGSIPDAVRASVSLPGVFPPFELNGHEYVDGGVLENLPTRSVQSMQADVVLAVSVPLLPVAKGDLGSILGVLQRSFSVGIEAAEREQRKLADVVMIPDVTGFGAADYLKSADLAKRGYAAAEGQRAALLKYALSDADWAAYLERRARLGRGAAGPVLRVRITAPDQSATLAIQRLFAPLVNKPVDTAKIEALLDQVRSDGAYEADYTVGYETAQQFAEQAAGKVALPSDVINVPTATRPDQLPSAPPSAPATPQATPGAPNPKISNAPTSNQPGVQQTGTQPVAPDTHEVAPASDAKPVSRPGAAGLAATKDVTSESLSDVAARPIILISVTRKKTGPPFLFLGANIESQTTAFTRGTFEAVVLDQDFGGYGSELRSRVKLGYETELGSEYFRLLNPLSPPEHTVFVAPHFDFLREPFPIYDNQTHLANRQLQRFSAGGDVGWTNQRTQEVRAGLDFAHVSWNKTIGTDGQANFAGTSQRARIRYDYDTQDRALVPQFGAHFTGETSYLYSAVNSENTPQFFGRATYAHRFGLHRYPAGTLVPKSQRGHEVFVIAGEGGTMFHHNVAQPFRYTLGGPLRLSASAIDQYRGTDYFLFEPALLRRIAQLPQPLGQSIYFGAGFEEAAMFAPDARMIHRQDVYLGIVAETPLGVITLAPAIGSNGERKFIFTLGRLF